MVGGHSFRFPYAKALTLSDFAAVDWTCFLQCRFSVNSSPRYFALVTLEGLVMESVAGGDTVPCLGHTQWVTFHSVKDISHLLSQDSGVLLLSCSWMESIGVLMTE